MVLVIAFPALTKIGYDTYNESAKYLSHLLTPTTVCLAVPLYEQLSVLKQNKRAILISIASGVLTALCSVFLLCKLFALSHTDYVTLLPKVEQTQAVGVHRYGRLAFAMKVKNLSFRRFLTAKSSVSENLISDGCFQNNPSVFDGFGLYGQSERSLVSQAALLIDYSL